MNIMLLLELQAWILVSLQVFIILILLCLEDLALKQQDLVE
jgi:hypothetical protein